LYRDGLGGKPAHETRELESALDLLGDGATPADAAAWAREAVADGYIKIITAATFLKAWPGWRARRRPEPTSVRFRWLWCSSLTAAAATGMERTATALLALESGGGAFAVGLVLAARMLPSLLFGLASGTIADRVDRRRQLVTVGAAAVPVMAGLGWLARPGTADMAYLVPIAFGIGGVSVFDALGYGVPHRRPRRRTLAHRFGTSLRSSGHYAGSVGAGVVVWFTSRSFSRPS
jgi:MFS family permease